MRCRALQWRPRTTHHETGVQAGWTRQDADLFTALWPGAGDDAASDPPAILAANKCDRVDEARGRSRMSANRCTGNSNGYVADGNIRRPLVAERAAQFPSAPTIVRTPGSGVPIPGIRGIAERDQPVKRAKPAGAAERAAPVLPQALRRDARGLRVAAHEPRRARGGGGARGARRRCRGGRPRMGGQRPPGGCARPGAARNLFCPVVVQVLRLTCALLAVRTGCDAANVAACVSSVPSHARASEPVRLLQAHASLQSVAESVAADMPLDCWTIDMRGALHALGTVTGEAATEEVLDVVFSKFCIGK
jgi:MnmE helical domain